MKAPPFLDGEALAAAAVSPREAMAAIEAGLAALGRNAAQQPPPPSLVPGKGAFFQPLLAALPEEGVACVNWLTYHPDNPAAGRPHSGGLLILNDFATGVPLALMDGIWVSHRRTGYIAGLGAKYLAGPPAGVALIGPGAIAAFALDALASLGLLSAGLRICGRREAAVRAFCAETSARLGVAADYAPDPRAAVAGARLVITATSHEGAPFLERDWIAPGTLVIMIDRLRLITPGLLERADRIVTNSRESLVKWGVAADDRRVAGFPELVAAGKRAATASDEIVLYDAGGLAVADLAYAALLWRRLAGKQ
ncbi:MAG: ornithine cyclodeaminase family protein [Rhodospirillaceae bacterium]|nr:ornithine cyclodeaminase family protein [Rhodospirillaceae bacterium]